MNLHALKVERLAADAITAGAPVVFDHIVYTDGTISYGMDTGVVTFHKPGRYIVDWWVSAPAEASPTGLVFVLSTSQGDHMEGGMPDTVDKAAGTGIVDVAAAPVTMRLINAGMGHADLAASSPVKATLQVMEESGITLPLAAGETSPGIQAVSPILNPIGISNEPYALIIDDTTQTPGAADTPTLVTLSTNEVLNDIAHTATSGIITFQTDGLYLITVSAQVSQTVAQSTFINLWLRKNGGDLPDSNRSRTLTSSTDFGSLALQYIVSMADTDTLELYQAVSNTGRNTGVYVRTPGAGPVSPSIILAINYIST